MSDPNRNEGQKSLSGILYNPCQSVNFIRIKEFLYLSGCGLAHSSTEVDWSILLNPAN